MGYQLMSALTQIHAAYSMYQAVSHKTSPNQITPHVYIGLFN